MGPVPGRHHHVVRGLRATAHLLPEFSAPDRRACDGRPDGWSAGQGCRAHEPAAVPGSRVIAVSSLIDSQSRRGRTLPSGWPVRRTPRSVLLAIVALVGLGVAVSLVHKPSQAERASDLRGFLHEVTADIESCAGGVGESLTALRQVESGQAGNPADVSDGISVAQQGSANCSPANNELIGNLENYQVPQSLDSFGLKGAVSDLVTWAAPDGQ